MRRLCVAENLNMKFKFLINATHLVLRTSVLSHASEFALKLVTKQKQKQKKKMYKTSFSFKSLFYENPAYVYVLSVHFCVLMLKKALINHSVNINVLQYPVNQSDKLCKLVMFLIKRTEFHVSIFLYRHLSFFSLVRADSNAALQTSGFGKEV
jgi:hypothetical protein